jgi:methyl-accepting chemotaxis protein
MSEPGQDAANIGQKAAKIEELHQAYLARLDHWEKSDLPPVLTDQLRREVQPISDRFWVELSTNFVTAAKSGDKKAIEVSLTNLRKDYGLQKAAIERLVNSAGAFLTSSEQRAHSDGTLYSRIAFGSAIIAMVLLAAGIGVFRRRAIVPLTAIANYMDLLAKGDFDSSVPFRDRKDEIGDMARAVEVFREAGIEKMRLEADSRRQADIANAERTERAESTARHAESLQKVVNDLGAGLDRLSKFNVRMTLDEPFEPEFEVLRRDFNKSLAVFQETMAQILNKSKEIDSSAESMRQAADALAKRTEQQAAALEETAAAMEEITTNVRNSAQRTTVTRQKTNDARINVEKSAEVVESAIVAMGRIEDASRQIGSITNVIDEIAFQTNLLALNAGVEAARAGEAGKGFAVVAQEVRELAQRSAHAAKEIKGLIERSGREVGQGVSLVQKTGDALSEIETSIRGIAVDIDAIAIASSEQSTGLSEVNIAINQMDQITQQNAAMVEESTAATHGMAEEIAELVRLVSQFVFNRRSGVRDTPEEKARTLALHGHQPGRRAAA